MENSKDLENQISNASSTLTKSLIGINGGGVLLLGSLLNALLAMPDRNNSLIATTGGIMYLGIIGVTVGLGLQLGELKQLVARKSQKKSHVGYNHCRKLFWLTAFFALASYTGIAIKLSFFS